MNPYEFNEYEAEDLYCEKCGKLMSTEKYLDNIGICDDCAKFYDSLNTNINKENINKCF